MQKHMWSAFWGSKRWLKICIDSVAILILLQVSCKVHIRDKQADSKQKPSPGEDRNMVYHMTCSFYRLVHSKLPATGDLSAIYPCTEVDLKAPFAQLFWSGPLSVFQADMIEWSIYPYAPVGVNEHMSYL